MPSLRLLYSLLCDTVLLLLDTFFPPHGFKPQPRPQAPWQHGEAEPWRFSKKSKSDPPMAPSDLNRPSRWQGNQNRLLTQLGRYFLRPGPGTWSMGHEPGDRLQQDCRGLKVGICVMCMGEQAAPKMLAALSLLRLEVRVITEHLCHSSGLALVRCASKPPSSCVVGRLSMPIAHGRCQIFVTSHSAFSRNPQQFVAHMDK